MKFNSKEEYRNWALSQNWYQSITLSCDYKTPGNIDSEQRIEIFKKYNFQGKRVVDIGCNSGLYSLMSKRLGAAEVIGIDTNMIRLEQARIIAENENQDISYLAKGIEDVAELGVFDIVICIAVLTEIQDLIGAVEKIKSVTNELAFVELDIAKPMVYVPSFRKFVNLLRRSGNMNLYAEGRKSKNGWMISPGMGLLKNLFGEEFIIRDLGKNLRYRLLEIKKKK